jgi:peptidoglycan/LPS O-acetylase OafA/YrhL
MGEQLMDGLVQAICGGVLFIVFILLGFCTRRSRRNYLVLFAVLTGAPFGLALDVFLTHDGPDCGMIGVPLELLFSVLIGVVARAIWNWFRPPSKPQLEIMASCGVCGYDLRATPNRCPECGTVADQRQG